MRTIASTTAAAVPADILQMWADGVINRHRFASDEYRILSRFEETDTVMPSADDLTEIGFDVVRLAKALEAGLNPELFGKAYPLVIISNQTIRSRGKGETTRPAITTKAAPVAITADMLEMWADCVIDRYRFASDEDRILSRFEGTATVIPSADDLSRIGFDVVGLAKALEAGLNPELFGKAYPLVKVAEFNIALTAGLDIPLYNERLEFLAAMAIEGVLAH